MMKQVGIALALLFLACWFGQSSAQCNCNDTACRNQAMQDNPDTQMCCTWVPQPIDTDPNSLNDANGTPLGFRLDEYQGTDSNLPDLCVRVNYPTPRENVRYVVVSVQSDSQICINRRNAGNDEEPSCGSGGVFFCRQYSTRTNIELEFYCGAGQGSCPVDNPTFYFRPNITQLDTDDEFFCDNIDRTLPSSLVQDLTQPTVNINPQGPSGDGAAFVTSLVQPALLLVTLLAILLFY